MDFTMTFYTQSGEFKPGCMVDKWTKHLKEFFKIVGLEPEPGPKLEGWVRGAGFTNVHVQRLPLPVGMWPKDKRLASPFIHPWRPRTRLTDATEGGRDIQPHPVP